jgi:hypothetical protein
VVGQAHGGLEGPVGRVPLRDGAERGADGHPGPADVVVDRLRRGDVKIAVSVAALLIARLLPNRW